MPELPEIETCRLGLAPLLVGRVITDIIIREHRLRWPISAEIEQLRGQEIKAVSRRAKYLILSLANDQHCLIHLGMSGCLRFHAADQPAEKHDHVDWVIDEKHCLRLTDPRRFGAVLWTDQPIEAHPRLQHLGPEPLTEAFNPDYFQQQCKKRKRPIKLLLMDNKIVVGVGNIYACESLFLAGIHPEKMGAALSKEDCERLVAAVKTVLQKAISAGGTTLKDFRTTDGKPGYFKQQLAVYGKAGEACDQCGNAITQIKQSGRSTFFCSRCQA